jgi:glycosyltransferase involved in cell wall biosynthesis
MKMIKIDIGIFAHNEASGISEMLSQLVTQDVFLTAELDVRIVVLANGCTDATATIARSLACPGIEIVELKLGGKSRTWNSFVHHLSRPDADALVFCDADISFPEVNCLRRLCEALISNPQLWAVNSQPVKDIVYRPNNLSFVDKIIASASGGLDDWKTAICGSLYTMPSERARRFHLPIGLPVEDGFLRAMILTDVLVNPEDFTRITGVEGLFHIYESERTIKALIRHQERIVIGSAINTACFSSLRAMPKTERALELFRIAEQERWLDQTIKSQLPKWPSGYIPFHFWLKRIMRFSQNPNNLLQPKKILITLLGFGFDTIVFIRAQVRMLLGTGSGFW